MAKTSEAQIRATARYDRENVQRITIKLNRKTDADIIEWYANQPNKQMAVREAIRAEIERSTQ